MIAEDLIILTLVNFLNFIAILIAIYVTRRSPPKTEMILIILALVSAQVGYIFYSVNLFYSTQTIIHLESVVFTRIAYMGSLVGIMLVTYTILFVDFQPKYFHLVEVRCWTT